MSGWQGECDTFFLFLKIELWSFQWDYSGVFVGDVVVATVVQVKASIRKGQKASSCAVIKTAQYALSFCKAMLPMPLAIVFTQMCT